MALPDFLRSQDSNPASGRLHARAAQARLRRAHAARGFVGTA